MLDMGSQDLPLHSQGEHSTAVPHRIAAVIMAGESTSSRSASAMLHTHSTTFLHTRAFSSSHRCAGLCEGSTQRRRADASTATTMRGTPAAMGILSARMRAHLRRPQVHLAATVDRAGAAQQPGPARRVRRERRSAHASSASTRLCFFFGHAREAGARRMAMRVRARPLACCRGPPQERLRLSHNTLLSVQEHCHAARHQAPPDPGDTAYLRAVVNQDLNTQLAFFTDMMARWSAFQQAAQPGASSAGATRR